MSRINKLHVFFSEIMYKKPFSETIERLLSHLTYDNRPLKQRPGVETYESTATQVLITAMCSEHYEGIVLNDEDSRAQFWERVLNHKKPEVLTVAWSNLMKVIRKTNSAMIFELGYMSSIKIFDEPCNDPDLQDAIFDFIYSSIVEMERNSSFVQYDFSKGEEHITFLSMCVHIFNKLIEHMKNKEFYPKGEFFKLLGKTYGFLTRNGMDNQMQNNSNITIYEAFLDYSGMEANFDCRLSISEILYELYIDHRLTDNICK